VEARKEEGQEALTVNTNPWLFSLKNSKKHLCKKKAQKIDSVKQKFLALPLQVHANKNIPFVSTTASEEEKLAEI
jgi:hypothetical protein